MEKRKELKFKTAHIFQTRRVNDSKKKKKKKTRMKMLSIKTTIFWNVLFCWHPTSNSAQNNKKMIKFYFLELIAQKVQNGKLPNCPWKYTPFLLVLGSVFRVVRTNLLHSLWTWKVFFHDNLGQNMKVIKRCPEANNIRIYY